MKVDQWTVRYWVGGTKYGKWKEVLGKFNQMDAQKKMREIQNMGYRCEAYQNFT